jgi:hypothetical protein
MARVQTFRDEAEHFRQLARDSADPEICQAALEVAEKLDRLAQAVENATKRGGTTASPSM